MVIPYPANLYCGGAGFEVMTVWIAYHEAKQVGSTVRQWTSHSTLVAFRHREHAVRRYQSCASGV
jgi:hypothetical protein